MILQANEPEDCNNCKRFEGTGVDEEKTKSLGLNTIVVDTSEVDLLLGDPTKAEQKLGWNREYNLQDLVNDMMKSDLKLMTKDVYLKDGGYRINSYFE